MKTVKQRNIWILFIAVILLLVMAACAPPEGTRPPPVAGDVDAAAAPAAEGISSEAMVSSVTVEERDGQYVAVVQGQSSDSCPRSYDSTQEVDGNNINITLTDTKPADLMCAQQITDFTYEIPLDTSELAPGEYTVTVNGVEADQSLIVDEQITASAPTVEGITTEAMVSSVTVEERDGQYVAVVQGQSSDSCPRSYDSTQEVDGNNINITLTDTKPADLMCAQQITDFTYEIPLDTSELASGEYTVTVNGVVADQSITVGEHTAASVPAMEALLDIPWQWTELVETEPAAQSVVPNPEDYTLTLLADGQANIKADCNVLQWTYEIDGSSITFNSLGPSTLAFCGEQSLDQQFLTLLATVTTYTIEEAQLSLGLANDAGAMGFQDGGAMAEADGASCAGIDIAGIGLDTQDLQDSWQAFCIPTEPYDESLPSGPTGLPEHVEITFNGTAPGEREFLEPVIYIIPVNAYEAMWESNGSDSVTNTMDQIELQVNLLPQPPETSGYPALPYDEIGSGYNDLAVQVSRAAPDTNSATKNGFRLVGRWKQDANPVTNGDLRYVYQGFSNDGVYLVSFWYPVTTPALPDEISGVSQEAMEQFNSDPMAHIESEADRLNQLSSADWDPDLASLDAMIGSLTMQDMADNVLGNGLWQWTGKRNVSSGEVTQLDSAASYQLQFNNDGTYQVKADCNSSSGMYQVEGGLIGSMKFEAGPMTLAECGPDSRATELMNALQAIQSYRGRAGGDTLDLILPAGGGELIFSLADDGGEGAAERGSAVTGAVVYRQRIALPADAVVQVQIQDVSLADAAATIMGEQIIENPGQVPIPYAVTYDPSAIVENHTYSMSARITDSSGKLLFISDTHTPVITNNNPTHDVEIVVVPVG